MILARLFVSLRKWMGLGGSPLDDLQSAAEMNRVLNRERVRSDRTGDQLSVVIFTPRDWGVDQRALSLLVTALKKRLRCTDDVGWLDAHRVCAVLPGTGPKGACKVADDVCLGFPEDVAPPACAIYSYPPAADLGDTPFPGRRGNGDPRDTPLPGRTLDGEAAAIFAAGPPPAAQAQPLEDLLSKPMPVWKRACDVAVAAPALLLVAPLFGLIALAIRVTMPGPIFFTQRRSGRGGRPFTMYKFRTMVVDAEQRKAALMAMNEQDGPAFKIKHDPRVTPLGRFLRSTSLDELPQLWNVLRGDMSLVGPRPLPVNETNRCEPWQRQRLGATPGLTCTWQVSARSRVTFNEWVRMDVNYIRSQSFAHDLKLLLKTVPAVLSRKGAH